MLICGGSRQENHDIVTFKYLILLLNYVFGLSY